MQAVFLSTMQRSISIVQTHFLKISLANRTLSCYSIFSFQRRRHKMTRNVAMYTYVYYYFFVKKK